MLLTSEATRDKQVPNSPLWWQTTVAWLAIVLALPHLGCASQHQPEYRDAQGFHFVPPPGWVERFRDDAMPGAMAVSKSDVPLPQLGVPGSAGQERVLVRYDRLTAGNLAWLRVSVADVPLTTSLKTCVTMRAPRPKWKRESDVEDVEIQGLSAARGKFVGRWGNLDYASETTAVRNGDRVYFITASFPASDAGARDQVRQAIAGAAWQ